jgi:predicted transcriptional regulator of viral defense system
MKMNDSEAFYSQTQGIKLLETAIQAFGPVFSVDEIKPIAIEQGLSIPHLRVLISSLAAAGWIDIIKRGTYVVKSPIFTGEISPFAIAAALIQPMAISHWSACSYHGFTTQNPTMIQASTPKKIVTPEMRTGKVESPRGRAIWHENNMQFEFIHVQAQRFWGFNKIWVNSWKQVNITDPERTALDLIARSDIFGGISAAIEIMESALNQIDPTILVDYTIRYGMGSITKRMGWILERMGIDLPILEPLYAYRVTNTVLLDPTHQPSPNKNDYWQINENLKDF